MTGPLYFIIGIILTVGFLLLNRKHKWYTWQQYENSEEKVHAAGVFFVAFLLWPVALGFFAVVLLTKFIHDRMNRILPDKNPNKIKLR